MADGILQKNFQWKNLTHIKPETITTLKLAIKTGLAALATDLGANWLHLPSPTWAVVSAVIVMQANLGSSFNASWQRLLGTGIGALFGAVIASFDAPLAITLGLGMTLVVLVCTSLKLMESLRIATVTFVIVLLAGSSTPWLFGLERFVDVAFGILIALLITVSVWQPRARRDLRTSLVTVLGDYQQLYGAIVESYLNGQKNELFFQEINQRIKVTLAKAQTFLTDMRREPPTQRDPFLAECLLLCERLQTDLFALELVVMNSCRDDLQQHFKVPIQELSTSTLEAFHSLQSGLQDCYKTQSLEMLSSAMQKIDLEFAALRATGIQRNYGTEEALRFWSFLFGLKALAEEIQNLSKSLSEMYQ